jgi:hypothetical protein
MGGIFEKKRSKLEVSPSGSRLLATLRRCHIFHKSDRWSEHFEATTSFVHVHVDQTNSENVIVWGQNL